MCQGELGWMSRFSVNKSSQLLTPSYYIVLNDLDYSTSNMNCFYDTFMVLLHLFKLKTSPLPHEVVSDSKSNHI